VFPTLIARRMLPSAQTTSPASADPKLLLNVAVVATGLLSLAQGLPDVLSAVLILVETVNSDVALMSERTPLISRVVAAALHPLFGLVLLMRAQAITGFLWPRVGERRAGDA
jgi:hypothetical protein